MKTWKQWKNSIDLFRLHIANRTGPQTIFFVAQIKKCIDHRRPCAWLFRCFFPVLYYIPKSIFKCTQYKFALAESIKRLVFFFFVNKQQTAWNGMTFSILTECHLTLIFHYYYCYYWIELNWKEYNNNNNENTGNFLSQCFSLFFLKPKMNCIVC